MDKTAIEQYKAQADAKCQQLFTQINDLQVELERTRGDFRTYDAILKGWRESTNEQNNDPEPKLPSKKAKG